MGNERRGELPFTLWLRGPFQSAERQAPQPLPEIHGFPLRVVVPGYIGARSVKWLTRIKVLDEPSWAPVQRKEYLYYSNMQIGKHNSLYSNGFSIQDMPVSSAILKPRNLDVIVHDGHIELQGWAYSGGENWIERVEVSLDGGHNWYSVPDEGLSGKHYYTWRLWKMQVPCDAEGWIDAMVRAWDSCCNTQPTYVRSAWNWDLHVVGWSASLLLPGNVRLLVAKGPASLTRHHPATK